MNGSGETQEIALVSDGVLRAARAELAAVLSELSRLSEQAAPAASLADPESDSSPLFIYGIVGGKDVGKTTLINALAGSSISQECRGIGPGTSMPLVYVHRNDQAALRQRLARDPGLEFESVAHDRDVLRHVALVDLPDFDSKRNLPEHARRAAAFKPHLDAFVWVTTVRKIDHPELLRQMESVQPKKENFLCVVTFADEVIQSGKDTLDGLQRLCLDKMTRLYFPDYSPQNLFAICTLDNRAYDFPRLENCLVRQHSAEEIVRRRHRNAVRSTIADIGLVREHYKLDESLATLERLLEEVPAHVAENLPAAYWETVSDRVSRLDGPYRRMAARLFAHRIWGWPVLSAMMFPLSAVVSYLGGRLFFETGSRWTDYHQLKEMLVVDGLGLDARLRRVAGELRAKYLRLHLLYSTVLPNDGGADFELDQWSTWLDDNDRKTLDQLQARYPPPGFLKRWLVYLPLIWFPLAQPVLESYLSQPELTKSGFFKGLALTSVSLLSAGYILRSAVVLMLIYSVWLLWFYSSSARQVARQRLTGFATLRQSVLEPGLLGRLCAPYEHLVDLLRELSDRIERQRELLEESL